MSDEAEPREAEQGAPEADGEAAQTPSLTAALGEAARRAGVGKVAPGEAPTGTALFAAVGGIRGIVEAILPGLAFIVTYTITHELLASVIAPAIVAVGFIVARVVTRTPVLSAVAGAIGIAFSAAVALWTGDVNDSFVPGLITNIAFLVGLLLSLAVRWPVLGIIAGLLSGDATGWRADPARRRVAIVATLVWCGMFAARLAIQGPLYLAGATEALAATKLAMGLPLYAATVWITWLLMRSAYGRRDEDEGDRE